MTIDLAQAAAEARAALAAGRREAIHCNTLGWFHAVNGDPAGAARHFREALAIAPRDPEALVGLAGLLRDAGQLREAALHCDAALAAAPDYADGWFERACVMAAGGVMDEAARCYRRVVELQPGHGPAHAGLASIAARDGDADGVRRHAPAALAANPQDAVATAALASVELEAGDAARARELAEAVVGTLGGPSGERSHLLAILGDACDRLGDHAAAETAYVRSKQDFAAVHARTFVGRPSHARFVAQIAAQIPDLHPARWPAPDPAAARGPASRHVFVLGYPRSGNTLLENVLASLPGCAALEERPTLRDADQAFLAEGGLARLDSAPEADLAAFRAAYWEHVRGAGLAVDGQCFVDMDPLKGIRLPLIARLFPEARVLLVRRDPRDVVWSCFRTNFALTNAAMDFTTLEGAARHYDATMQLIEAARGALPLNVLEVHYHRLVQDFDATTRAICEFIDMPWSEDLRRFDRTARQRGVATASARQVRQGLFDGTRQWERHADFLAPVLPILRPWVERFGYA
ncbi:sulfotransferase [Novosphingobium sp. KCTC 2891]|uniref:tetratricopeptide repeat-containing sulfotransferase family protein n=1 Tax=Novosphingobium sp. KCTC 2891 TaxID=2989730 RepID=UPI002221E827|nr:tetratricopeptide repeat-containing sulfotransferase family protein [Novosphingobium sp. KCTC 2891]MCW1382216.1 sulfotransferase [Novosphingobium sp. KCTC 2891]